MQSGAGVMTTKMKFIAHLTAIWSHVLSSIKIISGIVCVKNIMKHDMIAEYLTTSNMR